MSKRFFDTDIFNNNKWFRKLNIKHKMLWFYLISNCDSVGVWEEDLELASFIIKCDYDLSDMDIFGDRIQKINSKKYWIVDFCDFQYGTLKQENTNNRPHQAYIALLKKHNLWEVYQKGCNTLKEKEKKKVKEMSSNNLYERKAERVYNHYADIIKPGASVDAKKNIIRLLKDKLGEMTLITTADNYRLLVDKKDIPADRYYQANNFYGQKAYYVDFLPDNFDLDKMVNNGCINVAEKFKL